MAMNLDAVLRIAAKVVGLEDLGALQKGLVGAEKAAAEAKASFGAVVNSASWQVAAGGAAAIGVALGTSVKAAMEFESAMADVRKVVPGLESAEGLRGMRQEILNLSKELPVSAEGLAAIMAAAGQAGIPREELAQFTRQAAQMGVAFDITAEQAGEAMAKLRTSLGLNQEQVVDLADAMNYLSNNMASSAAEVNEFMLRAGAFGKQVAMTTEQTAALGSAMIAAGAAPEVAATSFRNLIKALAVGESATAKQGAAFKKLGLDAKQVAQDMQVDAVGTIRDVFLRISKLPAEMRISTIKEIFGDEARALTPLITNMQLFDQAVGLVADKSKYAGSMLEEFQARAGTSANNFQILENNVKALQIAIGEGLLPAINAIFAVLAPIISVVADLAGRFPVLTAVVVTLTAALAALVLAAPAIVSFITLLGGLKAALGISSLAAGWAGLQTVIIVAVAGMKGVLLGFVGWVVGTFIPAILSLLGPVGWTVLAIAAVVAMAIAFREPIMKFLAWLWGHLESALGRFGQFLYQWFVQPWVDVWNALRQPVMALLSWVGEVITWATKAWYAILWQMFIQPFINLWSMLKGPIMQAVAAISEALQQLGKQLVEGFKALVKIAYDVFVKPWVDLWNNVLRQPVSNALRWLGGIWNGIADNFRRLVTEPIGRAWNAVVQALPNAMRSAANFVGRVWTGVINTIKGAVRGMLQFIANAINSVTDAVNNLIRGFNNLPGPNIPLIGRVIVPRFAEGGFVRRPTLGLVGEAGDEYIIPASKMQAASERFLSGARGSSVIPTSGSKTQGGANSAPIINITTGPVLEFNGERYVTVRDMEQAMRMTAEGVIGRLRTPAARIALGR